MTGDAYSMDMASSPKGVGEGRGDLLSNKAGEVEVDVPLYLARSTEEVASEALEGANQTSNPGHQSQRRSLSKWAISDNTLCFKALPAFYLVLFALMMTTVFIGSWIPLIVAGCVAVIGLAAFNFWPTKEK